MGRQSRNDKGLRVRVLCAALVMLAISACSPIYRDHGYAPSDADLEGITVGVDTRETVAEAVGTPSSEGMLRDSGYYYVSQRMRTMAYHESEIIDRQVVAISFDGNGVVSNIERYTLRDGNIVALSRRVTDSNVETLGFLAQLFGNVGRFNIGENL